MILTISVRLVILEETSILPHLAAKGIEGRLNIYSGPMLLKLLPESLDTVYVHLNRSLK